MDLPHSFFNIGVTLVNEILQLSGAQFYNTVLYPVLFVHHPKSVLLRAPFHSSVTGHGLLLPFGYCE